MERHYHLNYLKKAGECAAEMRHALEDRHWNAAAILAVHCGISSADALTVFHLGKRHAGQQHSEALRLLRQIPLENVGEKEGQLKRLLDMKGEAEYSKQLMGEAQARDAVKMAERLLAWTESSLPRAQRGLP